MFTATTERRKVILPFCVLKVTSEKYYSGDPLPTSNLQKEETKHSAADKTYPRKITHAQHALRTVLSREPCKYNKQSTASSATASPAVPQLL